MPKRLIPLLSLAAALYATGAAIIFLSAGSAYPARVPPVATVIPIPTLPTVVVRPDAPIPTLALVTVRPDDDVTDVNMTNADAGSRARAALRTRGSAVALLPVGGLDMPYYSFGKSLRHSTKE